MIEFIYILGLALAITNIFKKKIIPALVPLLCLVIAIALNIANAYVYNGSIKAALATAIVEGGIALGIFASAGLITKKLNGKTILKRE